MESDQQKNIECPICLEIPPNEIFQCHNGHTVCGDCSERLTECSQCREKFEAKKIRCRTVENLLDSMKFNCVYKSEGCPARISRREIKGHSESCQFGGDAYPFCKYLGFNCNFKINIKNIDKTLAHLKHCHDFIMHENNNNFDIKLEGLADLDRSRDSFWTPVMVRLEDSRDILLFLSMYNKRDQTIAFTSFQIGREAPQSQPEDYSVITRMVSKNNLDEPSLQWTAPPLHIKYAKTAINQPYFRFPASLLIKKFADDGVVQIDYFVTPRAEEEVAEKAKEVLRTLNIPMTASTPNSVSTAPGASTAPASTPTVDVDTLVELMRFCLSVCDNCNKKFPKYIRYRCIQCPNYDICKKCVRKKKHDQHVLAFVTSFEQWKALYQKQRNGTVAIL